MHGALQRLVHLHRRYGKHHLETGFSGLIYSCPKHRIIHAVIVFPRDYLSLVMCLNEIPAELMSVYPRRFTRRLLIEKSYLQRLVHRIRRLPGEK